MSAGYLRVKKWRDHQHYKDREPPWIKMQRKLLKDDKFGELDELHQWQLVRLWMTASGASRFTHDEKGQRVPVIANDEKTLRRAIGTLKPIPLARFVQDGWLIPVEEQHLCEPDASANASTGASALLGTEETEEQKEQKQEQIPTAPRLKPVDPVWDFVTSIEGEPLDRYRAARGRIVADLKALLGHGPHQELYRRHDALAREWGDAKATARALVQNWHRAGLIADGQMRAPQRSDGRVSVDELYTAAQPPRNPEGRLELETG